MRYKLKINLSIDTDQCLVCNIKILVLLMLIFLLFIPNYIFMNFRRLLIDV